MFEVRVADNFHYMDEDEIYTHGRFETWPDAVAAAQRIVDRCLAEYYAPGMTAEALFSQYKSFGEDSFIVSASDGGRFSGWDYAKERCAVLCQ